MEEVTVWWHDGTGIWGFAVENSSKITKMCFSQHIPKFLYLCSPIFTVISGKLLSHPWMYIIHSGLDDSWATWSSVSLPNGFCSATIKYLMMYPRYRRPMERSLVGMEVSDEASDLGYEVGSLVGFFLRDPGSRWALWKGACLELHGALAVVWVENIIPCSQSPLVKLVAASRSPCCPSRCTPYQWLQNDKTNGWTTTYAALKRLLSRRESGPTPWKTVEICSRTWSVHPDFDKYTCLGVNIQKHEGWSVGISYCFTEGFSTCPSPWCMSLPYQYWIIYVPGPFPKADKELGTFLKFRL